MQKLKPMLLLALCLQSFVWPTASDKSHETFMGIGALLNPGNFNLFNVQLSTITAYREVLCNKDTVKAMFHENKSQFEQQCSKLFEELMGQFVAILGSGMHKFVEATDDSDYNCNFTDFDTYLDCIYFILGKYEDFILARDDALERVNSHLKPEKGLGLQRDKDAQLFEDVRQLFKLYAHGNLYNPEYGQYITLLTQNKHIQEYIIAARLTPEMVLRQNPTNRDMINFLYKIEKVYNYGVARAEVDVTYSVKVDQI